MRSVGGGVYCAEFTGVAESHGHARVYAGFILWASDFLDFWRGVATVGLAVFGSVSMCGTSFF